MHFDGGFPDVEVAFAVQSLDLGVVVGAGHYTVLGFLADGCDNCFGGEDGRGSGEAGKRGSGGVRVRVHRHSPNRKPVSDFASVGCMNTLRLQSPDRHRWTSVVVRAIHNPPTLPARRGLAR